MSALDSPLAVSAVIFVAIALLWRLTHRKGSANVIGTDDGKSYVSALRQRDAELQRRLDQREANRLPR